MKFVNLLYNCKYTFSNVGNLKLYYYWLPHAKFLKIHHKCHISYALAPSIQQSLNFI